MARLDAYAANAGLGLRYLTETRVWGINGYYDYRNTTHQHYNQVSAGLETLGVVWDFRINGYLPVGEKQSHFFHTHGFAGFKRHRMLQHTKRDFAMKGANAEAGAHVDCFEKAPLYFAGGPYYLTGRGATTWGGGFRASVEFFDRYLKIEGNASYDHFFKWIGQGQVSVNVPFGGRTKIKKAKGRSCSDMMALQTRAVQRIDRNEIIPVGRKNTTTAAINPVTGQPYYFVFVNNLSSSAGTYESPYPTLLLAENNSSVGDVIYVFPGDGTTTGMDTGIILKDAQMLLGASVSHPIITTTGTVVIPALAADLPEMRNPASTQVVVVGNDNIISGFYIIIDQNLTSGISLDTKNNLTVDRNIFTADVPDVYGMFLASPSGQINISNNSFNGFDTAGVGSVAGDGVFATFNSGFPLTAFNVTGNTFNTSNSAMFGQGGVGLWVRPQGADIANINISNNVYNIGVSGQGVFIDQSYASIADLSISNNVFNASDANMCVQIDNHGALNYANISNNVVNASNTNVGVQIINHITQGVLNYANISTNTLTGTFVYQSLYFENQNGTTCLNLLNNNSVEPGYFLWGNSGTINRTTGSDTLPSPGTNTGTITSFGTVNAPGSCTQ